MNLENNPNYKTALNRIQIAIERRSTSLDISGLHLIEIPPEICEAKFIKRLDLNTNRISNFHILKNLPHLEKLNINDNNIFDIEFLGELKKLRAIDAFDNKIEDISILSKLKKMEKLYLANNQISDIKPLEKLTQMQELNLGGNLISDLTPVKNMKNLRVLYVWTNLITKFPKFLLDFPDLIALDMQNNYLTDVPTAVYQPTYNCIENVRTFFRAKEMELSAFHIRDKVKLYVQNLQIGDALNSLEEYVNAQDMDDLKDVITILKSQWRKIQLEELKGTLATDKLNIEKNSITSKVLSTLDFL